MKKTFALLKSLTPSGIAKYFYIDESTREAVTPPVDEKTEAQDRLQQYLKWLSDNEKS